MWRGKGFCTIALLAAALFGAAPAGAYYVRFTANIGVFSPGLPVVSNMFLDSGQVASQSVRQPYATNTDTSALGMANGRVEGEAALGRIRLQALGHAYQGDANTSNYNVQHYLAPPGWGDTMTVTTQGTFRFTLTVVSRVWGGPSKSPGQATTPGGECTSNIASVYFTAAGHVLLNVEDQLCDHDQGIQILTASQDVALSANAIVDLTGQLQYHLVANSNSGVDVETQISTTAYFNIDPITLGADYSTDSGYDYGTFVLDDDAVTLNVDAGGADPAVAVAVDNLGNPEVYVRNVATGRNVRRIRNATGVLRDAAVASDQNDNGSEEVVLLLDDLAKNAPKVEVRDTRSGAKLKTIVLGPNREGVGIAVIADRNNNSSPEAVVLERRLSDRRSHLRIRDLGTKQELGQFWLPAAFEPLDLAVTDDIDGNGAPEAAVLVRRQASGDGYVLVWDLDSQQRVRHIRLPHGQTPIKHEVLAGPGGAQAIAVATIRESDGAIKVLVYDALTGSKLWAATASGGRTPVALRAFNDASGDGRLALLTQRPTDARPIAIVYDVMTGAPVRNVPFRRNSHAIDMVVLPDLAADANDEPEIGALVRGVGLRVRDSETAKLLKTIAVK